MAARGRASARRRSAPKPASWSRPAAISSVAAGSSPRGRPRSGAGAVAVRGRLAAYVADPQGRSVRSATRGAAGTFPQRSTSMRSPPRGPEGLSHVSRSLTPDTTTTEGARPTVLSARGGLGGAGPPPSAEGHGDGSVRPSTSAAPATNLPRSSDQPRAKRYGDPSRPTAPGRISQFSTGPASVPPPSFSPAT